jgi:hypothetical protein
MTTNAQENNNEWNYVRFEDYEDNANFRDWKIMKSRPYLMMIHVELSDQNYRDSMLFNPTVKLIETEPPTFNKPRVMFWVDLETTYDEITTDQRIGFVYRNDATNEQIEAAFLAHLKGN